MVREHTQRSADSRKVLIMLKPIAKNRQSWHILELIGCVALCQVWKSSQLFRKILEAIHYRYVTIEFISLSATD